MDISTVVSSDPCSEKLLLTETLIQRGSGNIYGVVPRNDIWEQMVYCGSLMEVVGVKGTVSVTCCGDGCSVFGYGWMAAQEALQVSWAWEARGRAAVTWGKDMRIIHGVEATYAVE